MFWYLQYAYHKNSLISWGNARDEDLVPTSYAFGAKQETESNFD
jgi:hypothetical protein